jgi:lysozyme
MAGLIPMVSQAFSIKLQRAFVIVALAASLAGCATSGSKKVAMSGSSSAMIPVAQKYAVHGVDVSRYQGHIDWHEARKAGTRFAFIKATEGGDHADENFALHWMMAKDAGVPRGAYHFYYWCRPVQDQIKWFFEHVPVERDALPPVLDVEWYGAASEKCPHKVPRDKALKAMKTFLTAAEKHYGKRPIIYTTIDFYRDVIDGDLHDYPLWVRTVNAEPHERYGDRRWVMWQYTDQGRVPGIKGNVDRNVFVGDETAWRHFAGPAFVPHAPASNAVAMN